MTITLALRPGLEQRVLARAAASGVSPEAYLLSVIEEAAPDSPPELTTLEQFEAALDAFSEGTEALPVLPPEVFTRESNYGGSVASKDEERRAAAWGEENGPSTIYPRRDRGSRQGDL